MGERDLQRGEGKRQVIVVKIFLTSQSQAIVLDPCAQGGGERRFGYQAHRWVLAFASLGGTIVVKFHEKKPCQCKSKQSLSAACSEESVILLCSMTSTITPSFKCVRVVACELQRTEEDLIVSRTSWIQPSKENMPASKQ